MRGTWKILCFVLLVTGLLSFTFPALVQGKAVPDSSACRKGNVYCEYPGQCHDYIDANKDNYCDRSIPASSVSTGNAAGNSNASGAASTTVANAGIADTQGDQNIPSGGNQYNLLLIFIMVTIVYGASYFMSARKVISTLLHHRIWNIVLLLSAIAMLILGLLLTLQAEYHVNISLPFDITFWHVETGIVMGLIAAFHIAWHRRYFTRMMKPVKRTD